LILMRIVEIVATRCQILRLNYAKFDFVWGTVSSGAPSQTPLEELTALPRPLTAFKGPTSRGREGQAREGEGRFDPPALLIPSWM